MSALICRFLALFFALTLASTSYATDEKTQVVKSFKSLAVQYINSFKTDNRAWVTTKTSASTTPPFERRLEGFINVWFSVKPEYGIDIQTSTSLMSPYTGTIDFTVISYSSKPYPTKEEAAKDFTAAESSEGILYRNVYAYQDGQWVLVSKRMKLSGEWMDVTKP